MDESGNKESDRFFVMGFLEVQNVILFNKELHRVRDQIFHLSQFNRRNRVRRLFEQKNLKQLYNFAKKYSSFELKFNKISEENIHLFQDLLKALFSKIDFKLNCLVIDRTHPQYQHVGLEGMYKSLVSTYSKHCIKNNFIFIPDMFNPTFNWNKLNYDKKCKFILPQVSDTSLPLQVVDVLTGTIGLALKCRNEGTNKLNKSETKRLSMVKTFEKLVGKSINNNITTSKPKYISVWTIDFNKKRSSRHGQETQP